MQSELDPKGLEAARAVRIVSSDDGSKWFVVDTSSAEPEVNWPGDLISEHDDKWRAELAVPEAAVRAYLARAASPPATDRAGVKVKPLEWRVPSEDRLRDPDAEENVLCADGIGGVYAISKKQSVGPERLLWAADDPYSWTGHSSIPEAKVAAQRDHEAKLAALAQPDGEADALREALADAMLLLVRWNDNKLHELIHRLLERFPEVAHKDIFDRVVRGPDPSRATLTPKEKT